MLPNGDVVPIPAAERWEAEAAAAAAAAAGEERGGANKRLEELRVRLGCRVMQGCSTAEQRPLLWPSTCATPPSRLQDILTAPASKLAVGTGLAVRAAGAGTGLAVRAAGAGTGLAVRAAGEGALAVLETSVGLATMAAGPLIGAPQRLAGQGRLCMTRSQARLTPAATGSAGADRASPGVVDGLSQLSSGSGGQGRLLRVHSSPDASLLLPDELAADPAAADTDARAPQLARQPPVRALLRQSSNIASAVLNRVARVSPMAFPGASRRGRSSLGGAPAATAATEEAFDAAVAAVAAEQGQSPAGSQQLTAARAPATNGAAAAAEMQQRQRRLHEQALAELVVLTSPAAALRPPELPSAASLAETAEMRLQEQKAIYMHRHHGSAQLTRQGGAAAAGGGGMSRRVTAPDAGSGLIADMAADSQQLWPMPRVSEGSQMLSGAGACLSLF